jgi:hypothetical protein
LKNLVSLSSWQHLYEPANGQNQSVWIAFLQIGSSQEIRANHLETVTPGLVGTQHQAGRFESLLDHSQLTLEQSEVEKCALSSALFRRVEVPLALK